MSFVSHTTDSVVYTTSHLLDDQPGLSHAFSTRLGGVSGGYHASMNLGTTRGDDPAAVRENYRRFFAAAGLDLEHIVMSRQVHGDCVRVVTSADLKSDLYAPEGYETDGLICDIPGVSLIIFSADCIPVLLYDPVRRVIAAAHAGWRGTAAGIAAKAAQRMQDLYGSHPEDILAAIGPGISKCCYETHADVPNAMMESLGKQALPFLESLPAGKFRVDLKGLNGQWLLRAGLSPDHIDTSGDCTCCLSDRYFSHRVMGDLRGSQIAVIQMQP